MRTFIYFDLITDNPIETYVYLVQIDFFCLTRISDFGGAPYFSESDSTDVSKIGIYGAQKLSRFTRFVLADLIVMLYRRGNLLGHHFPALTRSTDFGNVWILEP